MIGSLPVPIFVLLLVVGIVILVFVPLGIVFGTIRRHYYPDARIRQHGEPAEATITRSWATGVRVNSRFGVGLVSRASLSWLLGAFGDDQWRDYRDRPREEQGWIGAGDMASYSAVYRLDHRVGLPCPVCQLRA